MSVYSDAERAWRAGRSNPQPLCGCQLSDRARQTDRERERQLFSEGLGKFRLKVKVKDGWSNGRMDGSAGPLDPPIS